MKTYNRKGDRKMAELKATNTTILLTADENEIIEKMKKALPFLKPNKSAGIRYALFYGAEAPKCPECHTMLEDLGGGKWGCYGEKHY